MSGQASETRNRKGLAWWAPVLVAVVTLLAMGRLCGEDFTNWDDRETIHHNPLMNPPTWGTVGHYWTHAYMGLYVPVTYTAWAGLAVIARVESPDDRGIALNPWVFHTANVLVHVGNALLVYAILRRVTRREWAAAAGALVFGAHPVQVEAVGWVSGLKDLLGAACVLGAVWNYLVYAQGGARGRVHYGAALALTLLGTLCKPTAVVTPVLLAGIDLWVVRRGWRQVAKAVWPFAAIVVPCLVWAKVVQTVSPRGPVWARPLVAMDAVAFYLGKVVWPGGMAVDYGRNPAYVIERGYVWWTWAVPAVVAAALWLGRRRWPVLVGAGTVFVGGMLPVLGLTPFMFQRMSTVADHYLYLPMLGVALAVAWGVGRWPGRGTAVVVGVTVAVLVARSAVQAGYWADEETLDRRMISVNPRSSAGHLNLAVLLDYEGQSTGSVKLKDEAMWHYRESIRLDPTATLARQNLARFLLERGEVDEGIRLLVEAVANADRAPVEERANAGPWHRKLGAVLAKRGRYAEAAEQYRKALEYEPGSKEVEKKLADVEGKLRESQKSEGNGQK